MKTNHQCPKCSSNQVVLLAGQQFGSKVYPRPSYDNRSIVEKYACTDCGYVEQYLVDAQEMADLKKTL
jgi:ssDNA-binding Zn-finger/Zn-ribbon topoisomerase 1